MLTSSQFRCGQQGRLYTRGLSLTIWGWHTVLGGCETQ
jgi:hypothetical protein